MSDKSIVVSNALPDLATPGVNLLPAFLHRFDREQTRRAYGSDLRQFFGTDEISLDMARVVTFLHVNEYIAHLESSGSKASTIKRRVSAIRGFFDWLEALGLLERNPAHKQIVRRVRSVARHQRIVFLSSEQAEQLLEATRHAGNAAVRDHALLSTLLHCVLRRSEAAAMDFAHVRPLGRHWVLDLPQTKGGADQYVKIPQHVVDEIDAVRSFYSVSSGPIWRSLSNNARGRRLSTTAIYRIVRRTAARCNFGVDIGAHTLRHTGCTLAIEGGASLQQVKDHARHKNVETTMMYVHQRDRLANSAADFINLEHANGTNSGDNGTGPETED